MSSSTSPQVDSCPSSNSTAPSSPVSSSVSSLTDVTHLDQASATSADVPPSLSKQDVALPIEERQAKAKEYKDAGNKLFIAGQYYAAKHQYGMAIALDPSVPAYYSNRAASELKLEQHGLAIEDATVAIQLDPKFSKAYFRRASAHLSILDPKSALPDLKMVVQLEPKNASVKAQLEATVKLIRRLEFEKAIKVSEGVKAAATVENNLKEASGGTTVPDSYTGPRIADGDDANTKHLGKIDQKFINDMIEHFKNGGKLHNRYSWQIILGAFRALEQEPTLVDYQVPQGTSIDVIGDTHGQFFDFIHLLNKTGTPNHEHALLFNGDFVDRGSWSVEIALTMFAYKWLYPKTTLINRGNHETSEMNKVYGFEGECKAKFGGDLTFKLFTQVFVALPLATLITASKPPLTGDELPRSFSIAQRQPIVAKDSGLKRFFVVHGGLSSKDGVTLDDIRAIDRFKIGQPDQRGLMMELLWSDPQTAPGRGPSKRGVGLGFGPDITKAWCELNGVTAVLRSHEVRMGGYEEEHQGRCCTIFSAPNYCDSTGNLGAFARIDDQGSIGWTVFEAQPHPNIRPMAYVGNAMNGMLGM
ncbi:related to phosphoprotein phosphatase (serine/threonine specific protein phosphatase) [Melanopsichium pennsylvanicum]|uniref:Serine/threonine-protein phosphatase n=2 Tax=Melanopsichium pennsylvanicum TaxID=63383 RepID=A0AAJ5C7W8_9BASI|nr:related to phosphoprotein phosphatase (serine/threonine specific protein phosphatase) [Melanopsichium pennsylvanicum 4]SNX87375.1 related to phosphoprotein phosphatase (serine/threonine specific protein phosphatase) [Melanopsichium pennsylvanicum]